MKRTVKAWCLLVNGTTMVRPSVRCTRRECVAEVADNTDRVVPCTITYDDGRPAPRKRKGDGK